MIEITRFWNQRGPLTKRISLDPDGRLHSDGSACVMSSGQAQRARFDTLAKFSTAIEALRSDEAIALGTLRQDLADTVKITTKNRRSTLHGAAALHLIARSSDYIIYIPDRAAFALIDVDTKGMPAAVKEKIERLGGYWSALVSVLHELADAGRVTRRSTSTGIYHGDTSEHLPGSDGFHVFVLVQDGADIERFLRRLHDRCWLQGLGWMMVGAGGQLLERSLVDRMVYAPERLVFEAAPILEPPLIQDHASRKSVVTDGFPLDTRAICRDLSIVEREKLRGLRAAEVWRLAPAAEVARAAFVDRQANRIARRTGCSPAAARVIVERQCGGTLLPAVVLALDVPELAEATVGDVLVNPDRFIGATLADPLEGPAYGRCKAKIMVRPDRTLWINSFAHGRTTYELKHDASSIESALRGSDPKQAVDRLVQLLLAADLAAYDEQRLCDLACELSGTKLRPLRSRIKAARQEQAKQYAKERRERGRGN